jgi:hypothetical protein
MPESCIESNPAPTTPISRRRRTRRSARCGWAGQRLRGGHRSNRCKRATHRCHPAMQCSIPRRARSSGRFCEARRPLLWCMRNCGKAAPGTPFGDTPICAGFQGGAAEKVGSGRRDLVERSVTFLEFRVSGNPTSSLWPAQLVLSADW